MVEIAIGRMLVDNIAIVFNLTLDEIAFDDALLWFANQSPATVSEMDYLYDPNYLARNIGGLATETRIKDGSNNIKAKAQIMYCTGSAENGIFWFSIG